MRLRKFAIRSFCRSAQVKTEEGTSPSIYHPLTISLDGKWGRRRTISRCAVGIRIDRCDAGVTDRKAFRPCPGNLKRWALWVWHTRRLSEGGGRHSSEACAPPHEMVDFAKTLASDGFVTL